MLKFKSSIRTKITLLLLALSLIPLIIGALIITNQTISAIHDEVEEMQTNNVQMNGELINHWITQKVEVLENVIAANPNFQDGEKDEVLDVLQVVADADQEVRWYSFLNEKGTAYSTLGTTAQVDDQEHFTVTKETKDVFMSDVIEDVNSGDNILIIDVPILNDSNEFVGAIQAIIDPTEVLALVDSIEIGESGYGYLVSSSGVVLAHPENDKIGEPIAQGEELTNFKSNILKHNNGFLIDGEDTIAFQEVSASDWHLVTVTPEAEVFASVDKAKISMLIVISIFVVLVAVIAYVLARFVIKQISDIIQIMQKVSEGDLTERLEIKGTDEIAVVKQNINQMLDSFSSLVTRITGAIHEVATATSDLTNISNDSTSTSDSIAKSVGSVVTSSDAQYHASEQTSRATEEIASDIQSIAESATNVSSSAQAVTKEVEQGSKEVDTAIQQITIAGETVSDSTELVRSLKDKSQEVNQIILLISEIADQTNLLALNASIEAARAGEHGQGFTVVANEVKKLAVQTSDATVDIRTIIDDIIQSTDTASSSMESGLSDVKEGVTLVEQIGAIFHTILKEFEQVTAQIAGVSSTTEDLSAGTEEVAASAQDVTDVTKSALSELNDVSSSIQHQNDSISSIAQSAHGLSNMAEELEQMVREFKV